MVNGVTNADIFGIIVNVKENDNMNQNYTIVNCNSKAIEKIIWDNNKNLLMIKFVNSPVYTYPGADKPLFLAFIASPSKGKFFRKYIQKQFPNFVRLDN